MGIDRAPIGIAVAAMGIGAAAIEISRTAMRIARAPMAIAGAAMGIGTTPTGIGIVPISKNLAETRMTTNDDTITKNCTILIALALLILVSGPAAGASMRYLALGDSYTIGEGAAPADRWPVQLAGLLREKGIQVEDPQIIARTGWTVTELSAGMDAAAPRGPFDLVTLLIGVNDQYRGADPEAYRPTFARMLARATALAGGDARRVLVLSIPDWGVTSFARKRGRDQAKVSAAIDAFNAVNREEAQKAGIRFLDITPGSRRAATDDSLLVADGLHYAAPMYKEWATLALPLAVEALRTPHSHRGLKTPGLSAVR